MPEYALTNADNLTGNYETPFADNTPTREIEETLEASGYSKKFITQVRSPFSLTYELSDARKNSPFAFEYVELLAELNDKDFTNAMYEVAAEVEDTWNSKITNEAAMRERFMPFAKQQSDQYFSTLLHESDRMIDLVSDHFSGHNIFKYSDKEIDDYFNQIQFDHSYSTPAQDQFLGSLVKKVKSVVKKGADIAKKGLQQVGKLMPINIILNKIKGLVRPLLDRVLKYAMGKLPKNLQPYAQNLAKKFLNLETNIEPDSYGNEISTTADLDAIQTEFDHNIGKLVYSGDETEIEDQFITYEYVENGFDHEISLFSDQHASLHEARQQFIEELKSLGPGESPAPAIERFLPAAIIAVKPVIKMAISIIGRQKVINFLADLLAKLIGSYVPQNVAKPLSAKIIDLGINAIGFETAESDSADLAYEAIANTIEQTVQNMNELNDAVLDNDEEMAAQLLEAFEVAAADNFPTQYIRPQLRASSQPGVWVLKPRRGPRPFYKKYSRIFSISIDPPVANAITIFRSIPLVNFLRDKLGLDPSKTIQAKVHLYEAIDDARLYRISKYENVPGLGPRQHFGWFQLHPLTTQAAAFLLKEPGLGRDFSPQHLTNRHKIAQGQRFYFLEIEGARLRIPPVAQRNHRPGNETELAQLTPSHSGDIQGVINFIKSEIRINYYFSEELAIAVIEKLNSNDYMGAAISIRSSIRNILNNVLIRNVANKVKIIHEAVPEIYLDNYADPEENFAGLSKFRKIIGGIAAKTGKQLITTIIEKLTGKLSGSAQKSLFDFFKTRAAEFKQAQAEPQDGVTITIEWKEVRGMSGIRGLINAIKGRLSVGNLSGIALPDVSVPEIKVLAGKNFN